MEVSSLRLLGPVPSWSLRFGRTLVSRKRARSTCIGTSLRFVAVAFSSLIPLRFLVAGHLLLVGPCFLLSLLIHPQLNDSYVSDISWAFSMYLETTALLPHGARRNSIGADPHAASSASCTGFAGAGLHSRKMRCSILLGHRAVAVLIGI